MTHQPISLTASVIYQDGSIVSKEISRKDNSTVTLFAFAQGQGLSEHKTPYDAFALVVDGTADITLAGQKHQVLAGDMLHLPANTPHALYANVPFKLLLIMLK